MSNQTCSLKVVKNGSRLHGTAAILHMTSAEGGWDNWLKEYTESVARQAAEEAIKGLLDKHAKPKLNVV